MAADKDHGVDVAYNVPFWCGANNTPMHRMPATSRCVEQHIVVVPELLANKSFTSQVRRSVVLRRKGCKTALEETKSEAVPSERAADQSGIKLVDWEADERSIATHFADGMGAKCCGQYAVHLRGTKCGLSLCHLLKGTNSAHM
jgi:hypothetical protein